MGEYLFSFRGRLSRAKYWLFVLISMFFVMIVIAIAVPYMLIERASTNDLNHPITPLLIATLIAECAINIALIVAGLAITFKRLHDRNKSGWWMIIFFLLPAILDTIADPEVSPGLNPAFTLLLALTAVVLWLWGFVELGFLRGTVGDNRFGPDPLGPKAVVSQP